LEILLTFLQSSRYCWNQKETLEIFLDLVYYIGSERLGAPLTQAFAA